MNPEPQYLMRRIGHDFRRPELLEQALTHRSLGRNNNERLEFVGDAVLGFITAEALYRRFSKADEGQLSRLRAGLVKKETLAEVAREIDLGRWLRLGPGELRTGGHARDSILADALEAVFAAVYLDAGLESARGVILGLIGPRLEASRVDRPLKDPKTRLQERLQARHQPLPRYEVVAIEGSAHEQTFKVTCELPGLDLQTQGEGRSRRNAEQQAAEHMLKRLQDV